MYHSSLVSLNSPQSTSAAIAIQPPKQPYTGDFIPLSASSEPESSSNASEPLPPQPPQPSSTSSDPPQPTSDPRRFPQPSSTDPDPLHSHIPSVSSDPLPPRTTSADSNPTPPQLTSAGSDSIPSQSSTTGSVSLPHHLPPTPVTASHPVPSHKKRRSTRKSKKASSLGVSSHYCPQ